MGVYREATSNDKGIHVRMRAELLEWVETEAARRRVSRAALIEQSIDFMRSSLGRLDAKIAEQERALRESWSEPITEPITEEASGG